ncbi:OpgC domain-containing protein [Shewanella sp. TB7-MNA-CIBAN-0143]|jgi:hypothetical protein|uniref:OpgC domain-containing protein n=1 Tax=unclassified Shewanella TaxID=196818 RepID=UPI0033170A35
MNRIVGLDLARGIAIFFAMTSHTFSALNYNAGLSMNLVFRTSTPLFIVVFGFFLHRIYLRKMNESGFENIKIKLWTRAVQCYVLYALTCVLLGLSMQYSIAYTLRMIIFLGGTPFTDILKYYTLILISAPYLLLFISRYGLKYAIGLSFIPHVLSFFSLLKPITFIPFGHYLSAMTYGGGEIVAGPSILHSFIFILLGFYLSVILQNEGSRSSIFKNDKNRYILMVSIVLLSSLFALYATGNMTIDDLSGMSLRNSNAYPYFLFGCLSSILFIELSLLTAHYVKQIYLSPLILFGSSSLILFSFGNCILYSIYDEYQFSFLLYLLILLCFYFICHINFSLKKVPSKRFQFILEYISVGYVKLLIK